MAYYSGSAVDMAAVRSALVAACVTEGWSWDGGSEVLSHATLGLHLRVQVVSGFLRLLGRTSATAGDMSHVVQMGPFTGDTTQPLPALVYPVAYELFVFAQEVFCVINYAVDCYQWCAFGKSTVQGLPGTGMWVGASAPLERSGYGGGINIRVDSGASAGYGHFCPALFWTTLYAPEESRVHSDLDGQGWWSGQAINENPIGITASVPLIGLLPNAWNSEAVLLPIRACKRRQNNKISLTADLENARYTRVDNYAPGEIITIGSDRWKVFPWYRKNTAFRDGGSRINHTGTFGWAIRYEGP